MTISSFCLRLSALFALLGCGSDQEEDGLAVQLWSRLTINPASASEPMDAATLRAATTPALVAEIGDPILIAQVPARNAVAAMIRVGTNDGVDTFLTPDGISISTRNGMIVGTRGFGFDLMTADIAESAAAIAGQRKRAVRIHRYLDGENQLFTRSFVCRYAAKDERQITESCQSPTISFVNEYVLDIQGKILSSRQWVSPQIGSIVTEHIE